MNLPKASEYYNKLLAYADLCDVEIFEHEDTSADGWQYGRIISLAHDLEPHEEVATLLHELGHFLDSQHNPKFYALKRLSNAYLKANANKKLTRHQKMLILLCERRAWQKARTLARQLKIRLGKWFDKEERLGLDCYRIMPLNRR